MARVNLCDHSSKRVCDLCDGEPARPRRTYSKHEGMSFSPEDRAAARALLKTARRIIERRSERFICYALDTAAIEKYRAGGHRDEWYAVSSALGKVIMRRLGTGAGVATYEAWLRRKGILDTGLMTAAENNRLRISRLAWIDALIKEFSDA